MEAYLTQITLGDIWALLFIQNSVIIISLGLIHGHQR